MRPALIVLLGLLAVCYSATPAEKAAARVQAAQLVRNKQYEPVSKATALRQISSKLKSAAASQSPISTVPDTAGEEFKNSSPEELKRLRALYSKMTQIAYTITNLIPILEKNRLQKLRDGATAVDHLRDVYGKLEQLKPQFKAIEDKFPKGREVCNMLKSLEKQVKIILDDEERSAQNTIAEQAHQAKVVAKAAAAAPPVGIVDAQCSKGACCNSNTFKFLAKGTPCSTTECVTQMTCLGTSDVCPTGVPLPDGTACSKGKCLSGVCIKDKIEGGCNAGACCNSDTKTFKEKGAPCNIPEDSCQEPAEFCSGESATCMTTDKPDGAICKGGVCEKGICVKKGPQELTETESQLNDREEKIYREKKAQLKKYKKELEFKELKNMIRKFGVLLWMNTKLDSMVADKEVADYLTGVPGAPNAKAIFEHHRVPTEANRIWSTIFNTTAGPDTVPIQGLSVSSLIDTNPQEAANLQSDNGTSKVDGSAGLTIGIVLICIALVLIVAYFIFGGKKQKDPEVIY